MKKLLAIFAATSLLASMASADVLIGIVDAPRASQAYWKFVSDSKSLQDEQGRLQELQQGLRDQVDKLTQEGQAAMADSNNTALSEDARAAKKKEADDKAQQLQSIQANFQMQVQRFQRRVQEIQAQDEADVVTSIKKVAKANNLDVVMTPNSAFYAKIDITDQVIADLNANQPVEAPAATAPAAAK